MSLKSLEMRYALIPIGIGVVGLATPWQYVTSKVLNQFGEQYEITVTALRSLFADVGMVEHKVFPEHPHGAAAASRSTGSYFIERFGKELGREAWFYQCSNADLRNGRSGSRTWFWMKDAQVNPVYSTPGRNIVGIVDVDQYIDMNQFLVENFKPVILYTFQPSAVAADRGEYNYTFNGNNEVVYRVGGGAEYVHKVWNYNTDVISVFKLWAGPSWFKWKNWIPFCCAAYLVDKKQLDEDHQVIGLMPIKRWFGPLAFLARYLQGRPLTRFSVCKGEFLRLISQSAAGVYITTGRVDSLLCGRISARADSALASLARTTKSGLTLMHVKKEMPDDHLGATLVYEYHAQKLPEACHVSYDGVPKSYVRGYQFSPMEYDPEATHCMTSFMAPLLDGGFCPDMTLSNARQAVEGRITKVKRKTVMNKFLYRTIDEFVERIYRHARVPQHSLMPVDPEEVYLRQSKPTQRRILELAEFVETSPKGTNFIKREAYGKCTDPRIITAIEGNSKYRYSMYIYAFADEVLKVQDWYAFGKTPQKISERVVEVCLGASHVSNTDFSRFDGSLSEVPRALERAIMMYGFDLKYTSDLLSLMRDQQNMPCYISVGGETVKYDSGLARTSGSPETAAFNSIVNAFAAYLAWRMSKIEGSFVTPDEAFVRLGVYGGDDGVTPDVEKTVYIKAANKLGLTLDIEPVFRNSYGVKFLSRFYGPLVWHGDNTSMCDLTRAISKFHLCVTLPRNVTNVTKLCEKAYAYYLSDAYTPILGNFVTAVVNRLPEKFAFRNMHDVWNARFDEDVHYPNYYLGDGGSRLRPDWMLEYIPDDYRYDLLLQWIADAPNDLTYFLSPPTNLAEPVAVTTVAPVVVDGDVVEPPKPTKVPAVADRKVRSRARGPRVKRDRRVRS